MGLGPMKPIFGPFEKLLYSRKFLLLLLDVLIAAVMYFVIIIAIAVEDAAEKRNK